MKPLMLLINLAAVCSFAQGGFIDNSFSQDGRAIFFLDSMEGAASVVRTQPDGKIVVAGYDANVSVFRFNTDGAVDSAFGINGFAEIVLNGMHSVATGLSILDDGKILLSGYDNVGGHYDYFLIRLNSDGSLDNSFDGDGIVMFDFNGGSNDNAVGHVVQTNGKIVLSGTYYHISNPDQDIALVRFNSDGSLDSTFGINGITITDFNEDFANGIEIQPDDKIITVGSWRVTGGEQKFSIIRHNQDGDLDSTFGLNGITTYSIDSTDHSAEAARIQSDSKIVVVGWNSSGSYGHFVIRLNVNGSIDSTFGVNGLTTTSPNFNSSDDLAIQTDGKIIVIGTNYFDDDFSAIRLNSDGSLDQSFANSGFIQTDFFGGADYAKSVCLQDDGRVLIAGLSHFWMLSAQYVSLSRYTTNGFLELDLQSMDVDSVQIKVYPNPFSEILILETNQTEEFLVELIDYSGQIIYSEMSTGSNTQLSLLDLGPGIYFVRVWLEDSIMLRPVVKI